MASHPAVVAGQLLEFSHDPMELYHTAARAFARSENEWTSDETQALAELSWRLWRLERDLDGHQPGRRILVAGTTMQRLMSLFARIFFLGEIDGCVFLWLVTPGALGVTNVTKANGSTLTIHPFIKKEELVGTLAHEMVRLNLARYSCIGECRYDGCGGLRSFGQSGHGSAWLLLARAMEIRGSLILGLPLDLGLRESAEVECERSGWIPDPLHVPWLFPGKNKAHRSRPVTDSIDDPAFVLDFTRPSPKENEENPTL